MGRIEKKLRLGEVLVSSGTITEEQLIKSLELQKISGLKLGEVIVKEGFATEVQILKALEEQLGIESIDLSKFIIEPDAASMIPESICRKHTVFGIQVSNGALLIAMKDPLDFFALEDIRLVVQLPIKQVIAVEKDILYAIERFFSKAVAEKAVADFIRQYKTEADKQTINEKINNFEDVSSAPIVRFISSIIENAVRNNASDVHIEPQEDAVRIRIRVDGILQESLRIDLEALNAITSRIKVMSNLNIAERRIPQDGRFSYTYEGRNIDLRISTLPTTYGEKIVMRILDRSKFFVSKERLGLSNEDSDRFDRMISKPNGILLVTGPTGSGKTTTLYAMISQLNDIKKNIITLEDPVEYDLKGVNQVHLNVKAGLTFAAGLRSILRQDPDIIMVGEIRDSETAEIAIRSSLTGHLVLSTLHTNDAPGAITRIIDMGIEPFLISSTFIGVIAQRLVRKICPFCRMEYIPSERESIILGKIGLEPKVLFKGKGCNVCKGSGYEGRTAVFEIMEIEKNLRLLIDKRVPTEEIRDQAIANGMLTLKKSCGNLILRGITTVEEMIRVTYSY